MNSEIINKPSDEVTSASYHAISEQYHRAVQLVDDIVLKNYLTKLSQMDIVPLDKEQLADNLTNNVRFFRITELVYEKEEFAAHKFAGVFNVLSVSEGSLFVIIDSNGKKTDFYMGVRIDDDVHTASSQRNALENALKGQFPGSKTVDLEVDEMERVLGSINTDHISSVSCVANLKSRDQKNQNFLQGLEKLVLAMQGERYSGIIIADSSSPKQISALRDSYEQIYTQLSAFAQTQMNYSSSLTKQFMYAQMTGVSGTISHTETQSTTESTTQSTTTSTTSSVSMEDRKSKALNRMTNLNRKIGEALGFVTFGISTAASNALSSALEQTDPWIKKTVSNTIAESSSQSYGSSQSNGTSKGFTKGESSSQTVSEGNSEGKTEAITLTVHNKSIENMLERIGKQLKRLDECESLGMFDCAAYFLSDNSSVAEVAAATYQALMRGENSGVEITAVNSWADSQRTSQLSRYLTNLIHPVFRYGEDLELTACSTVSSSELAVHMGLPRHSVCGLPVIEHAAFGMEVVTYDNNTAESVINLGKVFHMGAKSKTDVRLDRNSLSMHTFVTGSTGSGKSNTVYEILRQLRIGNTPFMVIEPAKGEYKNVFGHYSDVSVLGTNPSITEMLHINPFRFPEKIHVLEHIDRLIEIFNVCWPMYAAMPAVLKDAVLQAYQDCGWDLNSSENRWCNNLFPSFSDVLASLSNVIAQSAYSDEVKGNYIGSLATRLRSLTNGINGQIFSASETDNTTLFDRNVIIDISRVGSAETKSLLMGILVMRLNEHRMAGTNNMNNPLQHVTVLEEAHNILKKSTGATGPEGSDVSGKSVEMLSNAIAEMRTYGEGFIIADQSPDNLDMSAIRNTNTKIIMRLPDESDRRLVGKAAGMKDEQLDEITRLPCGVAAVYQNNWVEPVLCQITKAQLNEEMYCKPAAVSVDNGKKQLLLNLLHKFRGENPDMNLQNLTDSIAEAEISSAAKLKAIKAVTRRGRCAQSDISPAIYALLCTKDALREAATAETIDEWQNAFRIFPDSPIYQAEETDFLDAVECVLLEQINRGEVSQKEMDTWKRHRNRGVI